VSFYPIDNLRELLIAIDKLNLKKPVFVKMPIDKTDKEILSMLKEISEHKIAGVIFGNLQKDRKNKNLVLEEVSKFKVGNFSGKPTYDRSNELIKLCYKNYKDRFVIIGCGGVFDAKDAYEKISLGASLVQLITGMIFNGPQIISQINSELPNLLKKNGFTYISQAIGSKVK
jgi:dihydroorotate dehydrogenase